MSSSFAGCPAFAAVGRDALADVAGEAEIASVAAVTTPTFPALVVQRGGLVVRDDQDRTVDLVAAGEFHAPDETDRLEPVVKGL